MPWYKVPLDSRFGEALLTHGVNAGFDLAAAEELRLDHSILVPLHFLTPAMDIPIVPIFIRGLATPLPRARRCHALGKMIRRFVAAWPENQRVAIIASGSFSLDVGGPQMGWIDQEWIDLVVQRMITGKIPDLVRHATPRRMLAAGNTGGELLNWIALLGALDDRRPTFIEPDLQPPEAPRDGHAYGVWEDNKS
jgi:protocatechuate 4,5-dioxygenase beta chain